MTDPAQRAHQDTVTADAGGEASTVDSSAAPAGDAVDPQHLAPGTRFGRYVLEELLGSGGMGVVYRARDPDLGRTVAIKRLGRLRADWQWRARLLREAQAMARLDHPNVVTVYDVGLAEDGLFVAMEYVEGVTLREWWRLPRTHAAITAAFAAAGRGLHAVHCAGLVHRDFKPDNVLVSVTGQVRVTDFGLVRAQDDEDVDPAAPAGDEATAATALTRAGAVLGTPGYLAPEQYRRGAVDARTDQFGFACALYEALHGERPFADEAAVLAGAPLAHPRDLSPWLRQLLDRALAVDPERRFQSMAELVTALEANPAGARRRRRRWFAGGAAAVLAIGGSLAVLAYRADARLAACRDAPDELAAVIGAAPSRADDGHRAATWRLLDGVIARHAAALRAGREQTCTASARDEQSAELAERRTVCLDERRDELAALVQLVARPDTDPAQLVAAARGLHSIEACSDIDRLAAEPAPPRDPVGQVAQRSARAAIDAAHVLAAAGQVGLAMEQAERAVAAARTAASPRLAAEAVTELAASSMDPEQRWPTAWRAVRETAAAGTAQGHARAIATVARYYAAEGKFEEAARWADLAVPLAERGGDRGELAGALSIAGHSAWALGRTADARAALDRCAAVAHEAAVATVELLCLVMSAQVSIQLADRVAALATASSVIARVDERAAELSIRDTYELFAHVAVVLINAHDETGALALLDRAQVLLRDGLAARDPAVTIDTYGPAILALERGVALLQLGRDADAGAALATAEAGFVGADALLAVTQLQAAEVDRRLGHADAAAARVRTLSASELLTPRDRAMLAAIATHLALDRGDCAAATAALPRPSAGEEAPDERGDRLIAQARLAQARGDTATAAHELADARAAFALAHNQRRLAEPLAPARCR